MKNNKWISLALVLVISILMSLYAPVERYAEAATVKLNKTSLSMNVGKTYTLKLQNATSTVKWTTSNKSIATVSKGKITAKKEGKTNITATHKGKKYNCAVTVNGKTVNVLYRAVIFDDITVEDYVKDYKKNNPEYISVKPYNNEYIEVKMYTSTRKHELKTVKDILENNPESLIVDYPIFTKIEVDNLLKSVTLYTDKEQNEPTLDYINVSLMFLVISDYVQGLNLVDINERSCDVKIIDNKTGKIIYQ